MSIGEQPAWDLLARAVRSREFQGISGLGDLAARGDCVLRRTDSLFRISNSGDFSISGVVEGDSAAVRVCFRFRCRKPGIVATSLVALGMTTLGLLTACDPFFALDDHRAVAREREAIRSAWMGALHKALLPHVGARAQPYR